MLLKNVLHAPLEVLPALGHLPFEEAPELFVASVLRFLAAGASERHKDVSLRMA